VTLQHGPPGELLNLKASAAPIAYGHLVAVAVPAGLRSSLASNEQQRSFFCGRKTALDYKSAEVLSEFERKVVGR